MRWHFTFEATLALIKRVNELEKLLKELESENNK